MAPSTVPNRLPFLVFPSLCSEYLWKIVAVDNNNRTVSRHKHLKNAADKAERLTFSACPCRRRNMRNGTPPGRAASSLERASTGFNLPSDSRKAARTLPWSPISKPDAVSASSTGKR